MALTSHEIHIWPIALTLSPEKIEQALCLLDEEESQRAQRFHSPLHRQRFIAAHAALRRILATYLPETAEKIEFSYTDYGKPYLAHETALQFNLSHSHEMAVVACTWDAAVGVDIEKVEATYRPDVAKRFFSPEENAALNQLQGEDQLNAFYRLWARKEALIKAVGQGLSLPLSTFSVASVDKEETVQLENETWSLIPLTIHTHYQAALASNQPIKKLSYCQLNEQDA